MKHSKQWQRASASEGETIRLWDVETALAGRDDACIDILRVDRPYERADIAGVTAINAAQKAIQLVLGAVSQDIS